MARSQRKKKTEKKLPDFYFFVFQCVAINIECSLNICTSYMDYSPEVSKSS
jgi:hypothetical protein